MAAFETLLDFSWPDCRLVLVPLPVKPFQAQGSAKMAASFLKASEGLRLARLAGKPDLSCVKGPNISPIRSRELRLQVEPAPGI